MPTYEYVCKDCGTDLEVVQSFADEPLTECASCGGVLRKVFGNVGISFKGSGFYKTDSRPVAKGKGDTAAAKNDSGSAGETPKSSEGTKSEGSSSSGDGAAATPKKEPASDKSSGPKKDSGSSSTAKAS